MSVHAACSPGEVRVAAVQDGVLTDYAIWRPGCPDGVGDVHRGRVTAVVPGMAGAFVALAGADGFLPDSAGAAGLGVGDSVVVRVVRAAQGGKGRRLAAVPGEAGAIVPGWAGGGPPALLRPGPNAVQRLAAQDGGPVVIDDRAMFAALRPSLGDRLVFGAAWDDGLDGAVAALSSRLAELPGGMRARIEPTAALVAIDMDMAAATAGQEAKVRRQEAANRAALPALARQIRLRNLSGAILIDFAGMPGAPPRRPGRGSARGPRPRPGETAPAWLHPGRAGGAAPPPHASAAARVARWAARRRARRPACDRCR